MDFINLSSMHALAWPGLVWAAKSSDLAKEQPARLLNDNKLNTSDNASNYQSVAPAAHVAHHTPTPVPLGLPGGRRLGARIDELPWRRGCCKYNQ